MQSEAASLLSGGGAVQAGLLSAALTWLIALPLVAAPFVSLLGRRAGPRFAHRAALAVLLLTWAPLLLTARAGESAIVLGSVTLRADGLSVLIIGLTLVLATLVTVANSALIREADGQEHHAALVLAAVGAGAGLACTADLFNLWVWFEVLAVVSYALVCLERERRAVLSATVPYLVQSTAGSTLAVLGIALVLAQTGTLDIRELQALSTPTPGLLAAGALMLVGFGVKAALAPLHTWLPDVYAQAPGGTGALLAGIITKLGLLALLRALAVLAGVTPSWGILLMGAAALNIGVGNLLALRQTQVLRLLACSSLAHLGYILLGIGIGVHSGQIEAAQGGLFHFVTHGLMVALAFLAASAISTTLAAPSSSTDGRPLTLADLAGAADRQPLVALGLTVGVLGLGGLPPLAGFMSEWQIFAAGVATRDPLVVSLVVFAAINVVLSLAYYAPVVGALYRRQQPDSEPVRRPLPAATGVPLVVLAAAVFMLGVWPGLLSSLTGAAGSALLTAFGV